MTTLSTKRVAQNFLQWARSSGVLDRDFTRHDEETIELEEFLPGESKNLEKMASVLTRAQLTGVLIDDMNHVVTVLAKNRLGPRMTSNFPNKVGNVDLQYVGHAQIEANPPIVPQASSLNGDPCHKLDNRFTCEVR